MNQKTVLEGLPLYVWFIFSYTLDYLNGLFVPLFISTVLT